jgi:hypothetical protein
MKINANKAAPNRPQSKHSFQIPSESQFIITGASVQGPVFHTEQSYSRSNWLLKEVSGNGIMMMMMMMVVVVVVINESRGSSAG